MENTRKHYDVVILGGGMGGLSCASFLVQKGFKPLLLEKERFLGGYGSAITREDYTWNVAVYAIRGLGEKEPFGKLLQRLSIYDKLDIGHPEISFAGIFGKEKFYLPQNPAVLKEQLASKFPEETRQLETFFQTVESFNILTKYNELKQENFKVYLSQFLQNELLQFYINSFLLPMGRPPEKTSAIFAMIYLKAIFFGGISMIRGGMKKMVDLLAEHIQNKGGEILLGHQVTEILTQEDRVQAVRAVNQRGEYLTVEADYFVSSLDPTRAFAELMPNPSAPVAEYLAHLRRLTPSTSAFIILLGLKKEVSLSPEFSFPTKPLQVGVILREDALDEPSCEIKKIYFIFCSANDPSLCPQGKECLALVTNVPFVSASFWEQNKEAFAEKLIQIAGQYLAELKENIACQIAFSPLDLYQRTGNSQGAIIGWDVTPEQVLKRRLSQDTPLKNLLLAGHWTQPGPDISLVSISGYQAANMIISEKSSGVAILPKVLRLP
jgi:phytoene dehydrogenase-like protein